MNDNDWKCPVCGYYAGSGDEMDKHIEETGHLAQATTEDAGTNNYVNSDKEDKEE